MFPTRFRFPGFFMLFILFVVFARFPTPVLAESLDFATTLKAAEQGDADAQASLGVIYKEGVGVVQDFQQALTWYTKAAEQGYAKAQVNLAVMYFEGQGVPQNYALAYVWSSLAAASGDEKAVVNRDLLAAKLTHEGLAEAQAQAARLQQRIKHPQTRAEFASAPSVAQFPALGQTSSLSGSGFIITPEGYLLTCAHVVENALAIKARLGERILDAVVVRRDPDADLALLKVSPGEPLAALAFAGNRSATLGQDVFTIGFPNPQLQGVANKFTKGSVSSMAGAQDDPRFYQISVPVQPGNSGGPLLDFDGNVVGVVKAQIRGDVALEATGHLPQNINYAVKSTYALSLIDSLSDVAIRLPHPDRSPRPFADVVAFVERAVVQVLVYK